LISAETKIPLGSGSRSSAPRLYSMRTSRQPSAQLTRDDALELASLRRRQHGDARTPAVALGAARCAAASRQPASTSAGISKGGDVQPSCSRRCSGVFREQLGRCGRRAALQPRDPLGR
jgi:hypothetical protein